MHTHSHKHILSHTHTLSLTHSHTHTHTHTADMKRAFLAALTSSVNVVFPFLCEVGSCVLTLGCMQDTPSEVMIVQSPLSTVDIK